MTDEHGQEICLVPVEEHPLMPVNFTFYYLPTLCALCGHLQTHAERDVLTKK